MNTLRRTLVVTAFLLAAARASDAAPITFAFEGRLTRVADGSPASVGDTFTGSFTYDTGATPTRTRPGEALFDDGLLALELTIGGWSGSAAAPSIITPPLSPLGLTYDGAGLRDLLFVQDFFDTATTVMGSSLDAVFLAVGDGTRSVFSSPVLPDTLDLSAFDFSLVTIGWEGVGAGTDEGVMTRLERVEVVPEPSTLALACTAGLISLLRRRRRQ